MLTLAIKCNLSSSANSTYVWSIGATAMTATGATSGSSVNVTETSSSGGLQTAASGSLAVSVDSSSPSYAPMAGGATGRREARAIHDGVGAHFKHAMKSERRLGCGVRLFGVIAKLAFGKAVREAHALFFQELAAVIGTSAASATDFRL